MNGAARPGEAWLACKKRVDDVGFEVLAMIALALRDGWPRTGMVDDRIRGHVVDVRATEWGPHVVFTASDGCTVEVHATRVSLTHPHPTKEHA